MRRKGDGWEVPNKTDKKTGEKISGDMIYVLGTIDGKFYRRSSGKKVNAVNIAWIKKNARDVLLKLIAKEENDKQPQKVTDIETFGMMVLENSARDKRSNRTQYEKIGIFKKHIVSYFKDYKFEYIKTSDIETWLTTLLKTKSTSTVKKCRDILNFIFKKAMADDLISKNYVEFAENIQLKTEKKIPYTQAELRLIIEHSTGWLKTYLMLVFSTGLRVGEAIGLLWDDIDLNNGFIYLERSITKGVVTDNNGNTSIDNFIQDNYKVKINNNTNKTKNHNRVIPLDTTLKQELAQYHINRPDQKWLFVSKFKKPFTDSQAINKQYWKPLLAKLDIKDRTLYATRHTYVTIMKNNGADSSWLKSVIGHKQSSTVMDDVYFTHETKQSDIILANNFFNFVKNNTNEKVC